MAADIAVYGRVSSGAVQRVLWACEELGLSYVRHDVGGKFGGNTDPTYLALNPNGTIPTLVDRGTVVWESNAIVRYLAARYGAGTLWPADPAVRSESDRWMDWAHTVATPALRPLYIEVVRNGSKDLAAVRTLAEAAEACWRILDAHLETRSFVGGDDFGIGDLALGPLIYRWWHLPLARPKLDRLRAWHARLAERPAFASTVVQPLE